MSTKTALEPATHDRKKMVVRKGDDLYVIDASGSAPTDLAKSKVSLSTWMLSVDTREEFRQMFLESWRLERDYFYDPKLHGVDYKGILDRHLPLVERVTHRDELSDLISSVVGERAALHIFVYGGDARRSADRIGIATLGAVLTRDEKAGGFRVTHI